MIEFAKMSVQVILLVILTLPMTVYFVVIALCMFDVLYKTLKVTWARKVKDDQKAND